MLSLVSNNKFASHRKKIRLKIIVPVLEVFMHKKNKK